MFEHLAPFKIILVSGPQRSGTVIAAHMIASDTGKHYIGEERFKASNVDKWRLLIETEENVVIQCPGMSRHIHEYGERNDVAVVFMKRSIADIIASQERIKWKFEEQEKENYPEYSNTDFPISAIKYDYWENHQQRHIINSFYIDYERLAEHSLWIPKEKRKGFWYRQWHK